MVSDEPQRFVSADFHDGIGRPRQPACIGIVCWRFHEGAAATRLIAPCWTKTSFFRHSGFVRFRRAIAKTLMSCGSMGRSGGVQYEPGESQTALFGGNSNWRGPVWFPMNYLLMESLERYHHFYGEDFKVECPTRSGVFLTLRQAAREINRRLCAIFTPDASGRAPWQGATASLRRTRTGAARLVPRILPRRYRTRLWSGASNGLDCADCALPQRSGGEPAGGYFFRFTNQYGIHATARITSSI